MTRVAFVGLGVMGFPMAGHLARQGPRRDGVQPHAGPGRGMVRRAIRAAARPTPREAAAQAEMVFCLRRQRRRPALGRPGAGRHPGRAASRRDHRRPHHGLGQRRARAGRGLPRDSGRHFIDAPVSGGQAGAENGALTIMCGGEPDAVRARRAGAAGLWPGRHPAGSAGRRPADQDGQPDLHRRAAAGAGRGDQLRPARRPRHRPGAGDDLEGRGPVVADGQSLADHGRGPVRLRLRGRPDAQGSRRSCSTRRGATARRCR